MSKKDIPVYSVESSVPIPVDQRNKYPFDDLQVGESFAFPKEDRAKVQSAASQFKRKTGKAFTIRIEGDGCRAWRIA